MKKFILGLFLLTLPLAAAPRYVTLVIPEKLKVLPGESAELVSSHSCVVFAIIGGVTVAADGAWDETANRTPFFIAGPCEIRTGNSRGHEPGAATFRILPDVADANATLILPPSTNQVTVHLQSSPNLVDWTSVASVTFTNVPAALFFRAKLAGTP